MEAGWSMTVINPDHGRFDITEVYAAETPPKAVARDVMRVECQNDRLCVLMANASADSFDVLAPKISSSVLDAAQAAWIETSASSEPASLLDLMFEAARRSLALSDRPADGLAAWLTAVCIFGDDVYAEWAGGDEAYVLRVDGSVPLVRGHSFRQIRDTQAGPDFLSRGLGRAYEDTRQETLPTPWRLSVGERVLVLSRSIVQAHSSREIADVTSRDGSRALEQFAASAVRDFGRPYATAVLINARPSEKGGS
jgi:hypothetical protein